MNKVLLIFDNTDRSVAQNPPTVGCQNPSVSWRNIPITLVWPCGALE